MNISVFGLGYVGCVSLGCLAESGHNLIGIDIDNNKINLINSGKATIVEEKIDEIISRQFSLGKIRATRDYISAVMNTSISIICVGTPPANQGHLNLLYIYKVAEQIGEAIKLKNSFHIIVIRSTVPPGTNEKIAKLVENISSKKEEVEFSIVSNPEFLREGSAVNDYYNPPFILIGTENERAVSELMLMYNNIKAEVIVEKPNVVEIIKYVNNSFHALKVAFANEIGSICKELNIDSHKVMEIFVKDKILNISPYYFWPGFAYGGSCLPKDLTGLKLLAHDRYLDTPIIKSISQSNELHIERALHTILSYNLKKIGFDGLSFKSGTDDLRNSPSLRLIEILIGKGFEISIFDENLNLAFLFGQNKDYLEKHIPHLKNLIIDSLEELINCSELIVITNKYKNHSEKLKNSKNIQIFDLVRLDDDLLKLSNYNGICW